MPKKLLSIILLTGFALSACGGQATQATETPTAVPPTNTPLPTNTPAPTDTPVPQETDTPLPTPTPYIPDNPADCTNLAAFVSDVTIPDNTELQGGETFTKTWRVRNAGTCIWWTGYILEHYSENALGAPEYVQLPVTNPGDTADISIDLVAPGLPGSYRGNFVIKNPAGLIMQVDNDSRLWLIINVISAAPSATPTPEAGTDAAPTAPGASGAAKTGCDVTLDAPRTEQVAAAINAYRGQSSIVAYTVNEQLAQAAQRHANDMACNQLYVHDGSDGSTPQTRVADAGYVGAKVSENVYGSYPPLSPEQVVTWWQFDQTDPNHNKNLISTDYTEIGVGYAFYDNFGYYVVVFGTP